MGARSAWEQSSADALGAHDTFEKLIFGERLAVLAESGATLAIGSEGVVIGRVYERGRTLPVNVIAAHSSRSIIASRGEWLTRAHWGSFVALLAADRTSTRLTSSH